MVDIVNTPVAGAVAPDNPDLGSQGIATTPVEPDPVKDPITAYDIAVESRSPDRLYKLAQANMGTPVEDAALHGARTIVENGNKFQELVNPIESADTPQKANIAAADAYKTVKDNPKWGTALIQYLMGQKKEAMLSVTGGNEHDNIVYDKYGNQVKETTNDLGQYLNRVDLNTGKLITPDEWNQRGGDVSKIQNTLSFLQDKGLQQNNIQGLNKTVNQVNAWAPALQAQAPIVDRAYQNLKEIKKNDIAAPIFAKALGVATQSNNNTNTSSTNNSFLQNWSKGIGVSQGQTVDKAITAGMGLEGVWHFDGKGGISDSNGNSKSFNELAQSQNTKNAGNENSKNLASAQANLIAELRASELAKQPGGDAKIAMMIDTFNNMVGITKENDSLVDKHGKPAFMFLPSSMASTDRYANGQVQLLQSMFNKEAMDGFQDYYKRNIVNYPAGKAPTPSQLEAEYAKTPEYKALQQTYADRAKLDLKEAQPTAPATTNKPQASKPASKAPVPPPTAPASDVEAKRAAAKEKYLK